MNQGVRGTTAARANLLEMALQHSVQLREITSAFKATAL
jgi:hypothetical protein